ncbi:protease pro-enzyme activation domain-containing protein [Tengunoibacter tsumagoiensis]|uniref:Peptidase S53 activation domain-containing protein n=1 Tax=Tengunoibacter tsumagoiensis TaxID=2014871 RepID=A0A402A4K5_9CHLR|nr:protease pro-enzyme activation domain-containing protein [Tengunoibacter tsumagoiensis]GCE14087.1 hypothetical protein KTT_39460 [Tengunoibacter tsumagoiensis]
MLYIYLLRTVQARKHHYLALRLRPYRALLSVLMPVFTFLIFLSVIALQFLHLSFVQAKGNEPASAVHGTLSPLIAQSRRVGDVKPTQQLTLSLGLMPRHSDQLEALLAAQRQGKLHEVLTAEEYEQQFGPDITTYNRARHFLQDSGFTVRQTAQHHLLITFSGPALLVEHVFHLSLQRYQAPSGESFIANLSDPLLPQSLAKQTISINALTEGPQQDCQLNTSAAMSQQEYLLWASATLQGETLSTIAGDSLQTLCAQDQDTFLRLPEHDATGARAILQISPGIAFTVKTHSVLPGKR